MVILKSAREIATMRDAGRITGRALQEVIRHITPGVTGLELDRVAESFIRSCGALPAFKGYRGFPNTITVSVNHEVVHAIPSRRKLASGDLVSIDIGAVYEGFVGDTAATVGCGSLSPERQRLLDVTREALEKGIDQCRAGHRLSDIGHAVQQYAEAHGYSVVRELVGHGIGRAMHEDPPVPNYGEPGRGPVLGPGWVLAIEPMVNAGAHEVQTLGDAWTVVAADQSDSAHFEHTVAVTENGPWILTDPNEQ